MTAYSENVLQLNDRTAITHGTADFPPFQQVF